MGIIQKKRKWVSVLWRDDSEKLNRKIEKLRDKLLAAKALTESVRGATEADPFKEVRAEVAIKSMTEALDELQKLSKFVNEKTEKGT